MSAAAGTYPPEEGVIVTELHLRRLTRGAGPRTGLPGTGQALPLQARLEPACTCPLRRDACSVGGARGRRDGIRLRRCARNLRLARPARQWLSLQVWWPMLQPRKRAWSSELRPTVRTRSPTHPTAGRRGAPSAPQAIAPPAVAMISTWGGATRTHPGVGWHCPLTLLQVLPPTARPPPPIVLGPLQPRPVTPRN